MTLTDEQLGALAERLLDAWSKDDGMAFRQVAREAARWADEQDGEVVWEANTDGVWCEVTRATAVEIEDAEFPVRAIRVIATTTKEGL